MWGDSGTCEERGRSNCAETTIHTVVPLPQPLCPVCGSPSGAWRPVLAGSIAKIQFRLLVKSAAERRWQWGVQAVWAVFERQSVSSEYHADTMRAPRWKISTSMLRKLCSTSELVREVTGCLRRPGPGSQREQAAPRSHPYFDPAVVSLNAMMSRRSCRIPWERYPRDDRRH